MRGPKKRLTPFGKMVVKALADRDMSRAELAATVGTSPQYIISGKPVRIKLPDYGFEYYGDHAELARVREKRCVYHGRAVSPTKEN